MTKHFNPKEWLNAPKEQPKPKVSNAATKIAAVANNDIETFINTIDQAGIEITGKYATWRDIGFALSDEYGESGREYFHRISKNYVGYDSKECDEQFNKCLNAKGHGITIATFYHHANQAGIKTKKAEIIIRENANPQELESMPTFPESVYNNLPDFLQQVVKPSTSQEEKDILLLGGLTAFSACFPNLFGVYDQRKVFSNLYLFVTAPASAGKGRLNQIKALVNPVHKVMREQAKVL